MRLLTTLTTAAVATATIAAATEVDIELVLAVDTSLSMDPDELRLQREGYAQALEHPAFLSGVGTGPTGRIAIIYFDGGGTQQNLVLPWTILETEADVRRAAETLRNAPISNFRGTGISSGILTGIRQIEETDLDGLRHVIDVSGDGPNNEGMPVTRARDIAAEKGIEINGLPFMFKEPGGWFNIEDLDIYYEDCVITGPSAFVMPVFQPELIAGAIVRKLVLEIAGVMPEVQPEVRNAAGTDCLIGEKLRRERFGTFGDP